MHVGRHRWEERMLQSPSHPSTLAQHLYPGPLSGVSRRRLQLLLVLVLLPALLLLLPLGLLLQLPPPLLALESSNGKCTAAESVASLPRHQTIRSFEDRDTALVHFQT